MKILITGATGFVGRNLVPYLFSHGFVELAIPQKANHKPGAIVKR